MSFVQTVPIRFQDVDPAGIVYYPTILHYCHVAFEEFFGAVHGTPYPQWIAERRIGFPTVHVEADFRTPLRYGDPLEIEVTVPRQGDRSLDFYFRLRVAGVEAAWARATKVCVELDTLASRRIPEDLREPLDRVRSPD